MTEQARRYYVYVICEVEDVKNLEPKTAPIGIDLGIKDFAIISNKTTKKNINKTSEVKGLEKKLSKTALRALTWCWLSVLPQIDMLLFRYMRNTIAAPRSIEVNFTEPDVLVLSKVLQQVTWEVFRIIQLLRFKYPVAQSSFPPR